MKRRNYITTIALAIDIFTFMAININDHEYILRATPSPPAPFISSRLPFRGLVLPFSHPGVPFWPLGSTFEDHGSSRMDTTGVDFGTIFERVLSSETKKCFFFWRVFRPFCCPISESSFGRLGLYPCFRIGGIAKNNLPHRSFVIYFGGAILSLFESLGNSLSVFCCPGNRPQN